MGECSCDEKRFTSSLNLSATGFKVDVPWVEYLKSLSPRIEAVDGCLVLNGGFESVSVPGLFSVGLVAARSFGPYVGFTAGCPFAGRVCADTAVRHVAQGL
jgi:hypothetical protein